jgi:hypothetical protein
MKRVFRRPIAGLALIGAAALIAGCGGGSDSDALSADELRAQADAICADVDRATDAVAEPTSTDEVLPFLTATREANGTGLERLKELDPPEELAETWNEAITLQDEQLALLDQAISRIEDGEDAEVVIDDLAPQLSQNDSRLDAAARELGLTVCGADDDEPSRGAATTLDDPDPPPATGDTGTIEQYVDDVQETAGALQSFGELLQGIDSVEELEAQAPQAQAYLDEFDAGIATMAGYTLPQARVEQQRENLVAVGPRVSDVLRRFVDAAAGGDQSAVQNLLPEVLSVLQEFTAAAGDMS